MKLEPEDLIGKTILSAKWILDPHFDDEDDFEILFTDGTKCTIEAGYGSYTGKSKGEYPAFLYFYDDKVIE